LIRFYPDGPVNNDYPTPKYYLTKKGIVYATKGSNYDIEVGAFFSPTINRWIKGKLTGYSTTAITRDYLATMDKEEEATLIAEGVSGLTIGSDDFKIKMFLLSDEVIEEAKIPEYTGTGSAALAKAMAKANGPNVRSTNLSYTYLDDIVDIHYGNKSDWVEVTKYSKNSFNYVVLRNSVLKTEVLAKLDQNGDLVNESVIGTVSFNIEDDVVIFGFTPSGGFMEVPDEEIEWVINEHYGIDLRPKLREVDDNCFEFTEPENDIKTFLENLGFVYDTSIEHD
jgi:hypothetical protein